MGAQNTFNIKTEVMTKTIKVQEELKAYRYITVEVNNIDDVKGVLDGNYSDYLISDDLEVEECIDVSYFTEGGDNLTPRDDYSDTQLNNILKTL